MSLWLSNEELFELTGKKQRRKQIEVLSILKRRDGKKIEFTVRPEDSFPLVERSQFESKRRREPDYSGLNG